MPLARSSSTTAIIEVETFRVGSSGSLGEDARPRDRKAIGLQAKALHELNIFLVAMVVIIGDVAGVAVLGFAGDVPRRCPRWMDRGRLRSLRLRPDRRRWPIPIGSPEESGAEPGALNGRVCQSGECGEGGGASAADPSRRAKVRQKIDLARVFSSVF